MYPGLDFATLVACTWAAVALDRWVGEPRRWHPLVGFGRCAQALEQRGNRGGPARGRVRGRIRGVLSLALVVGVPVTLSVMFITSLPPLAQAVSHTAMLAFALGGRSLRDHLLPIAAALSAGQLDQARALTTRIVSRDLAQAGEADIARAAVESTLENGNDAVFGALCWFVIAGGPGALAFRLVNTLDAMWGYRTPRLRYFGWAAARLDDALNLLPARAVALSYALLGRTGWALHCWRTQAPAWASPNAGAVMAAGAGALGLALGGAAVYHGVVEPRPPLGRGAVPQAADIGRALRLVDRTLLLWLLALTAGWTLSMPWVLPAWAGRGGA